MYRPLPKQVTIKNSNIDGLGLFATEDIPKGTNLGMSHLHYNSDPHSGSIEWVRTPLGGFYNHSNNPNCKTEKKECVITIYPHSFSVRKMHLITIKDITKGQELTVTYTLYKIGT